MGAACAADERIQLLSGQEISGRHRLGAAFRHHPPAREKLATITDHLAGKEMEIGRFYQRSGQWLAASYRFRKVAQDYQMTTHTAEALERLVECYLALGVPEEARKSAAVLGANYPGTYWYKQSLKLLGEEQRNIQRRTASRR